MLSLFKKSVSAEEVADVLWKGIRDWPAQHRNSLADNFSFERDLDEVVDEVCYCLGFSTDCAFWRQLNDKPPLEKAVRDAFMVHLTHFAKERGCKPLPPGGWLGDGLIWIPKGSPPIDVGQPLANLGQRLDLYGQALDRRQDKSVGERTAHMLAAWCGTMEATFIVYATPLFLGQWKAVKDMLASTRIKS